MTPTSPKRYSCRPHAPTAFMTDALWTTLTGMPCCRARNCKSVCVVALHRQSCNYSTLPPSFTAAALPFQEAEKASQLDPLSYQTSLKRRQGAPWSHPNGSPTTRKATSSLSAPCKIASAFCTVRIRGKTKAET